MSPPRKPTAPVVRKPDPVQARSPALAARRLPSQPWKTDTAPDPIASLEADPTDIEAVGAEIVDKLMSAYREREAEQREKYDLANSTGYYRVVVFDTEAQASAFNAAVGQLPSDRIVDGRAIAAHLNIELPKSEWKPKAAKVNPRLAAMALPLSPERKP